MYLFRGFFTEDPGGLTVRFVTTPLRQATAAPPLNLDFGDGSTHWTSDASGQVLHTYAQAGVYTAQLVDLDGVAQKIRFEAPYRPGQPQNITHCPG